MQGGKIVQSNQGARNGVIHVVNRVMKPTTGDIQTILQNDPNFSIFSQMVENLAMNFTNITLFAPTDQAFLVMDRERLERLVSNEDCVEVGPGTKVPGILTCTIRLPLMSAWDSSGSFCDTPPNRTPKCNDAIGLNNRAARAARILVHFLDVLCKTTGSLSKHDVDDSENVI